MGGAYKDIRVSAGFGSMTDDKEQNVLVIEKLKDLSVKELMGAKEQNDLSIDELNDDISRYYRNGIVYAGILGAIGYLGARLCGADNSISTEIGMSCMLAQYGFTLLQSLKNISRRKYFGDYIEDYIEKTYNNHISEPLEKIGNDYRAGNPISPVGNAVYKLATRDGWKSMRKALYTEMK